MSFAVDILNLYFQDICQRCSRSCLQLRKLRRNLLTFEWYLHCLFKFFSATLLEYRNKMPSTLLKCTFYFTFVFDMYILEMETTIYKTKEKKSIIKCNERTVYLQYIVRMGRGIKGD